MLTLYKNENLADYETFHSQVWHALRRESLLLEEEPVDLDEVADILDMLVDFAD